MAKKNNKQEIIDLLRADPQLTEDSWGNFKTSSGRIRFKVGASALRRESKVGTGWVRIWSAYYKNIDVIDGKPKVRKFNL